MQARPMPAIEAPGISEPLLSALAEMGVTALTPVQVATLPHGLGGADLMAKAKTGTGKTLAFLLPTVERLLSNAGTGPPMADGVDPVRALVLSSTRELATQIVTQAEKLTAQLPSFNIDAVLGGSSIIPQRERLDPLLPERSACKYGGTVDLMVATPGRLLEHIESTDGFCARLLGVQVLVLDEVDQLLDGGFQRDIEAVVAKLSVERQTLAFSATAPKKLLQVLSLALRTGFVTVDCVGEEESGTHAAIGQSCVVHPLEHSLLALLSSVREEMAINPDDYKVLAFLPTARQTQFSCAVLQAIGMDVIQIHSRCSTSERVAASDRFRDQPRQILLSSDVSARGVDYPNVTLVLQAGAPPSKEVYIQRLGRTGRAGRQGRGLLLLATHEKNFIPQLKGLPIRQDAYAGADDDALQALRGAAASVADELAEQTYRAWVMAMGGLRKSYSWSKQVGGLTKPGFNPGPNPVPTPAPTPDPTPVPTIARRMVNP